MAESLLYTVSEAAKLLKVNRNYIYELIYNGELHAVKLKSYKISRAELDRFIASRTI